MKTLFELELQKRHEHAIRIADEKNSLANWRDGESDHELEDAYLATQLADRLGVLLEFLSAAATERGVAMRVWCLLYAVRPDLVDHQSDPGSGRPLHRLSAEALRASQEVYDCNRF